MIYSRFSFHSITNEQQLNLITSIKQPDTYLCIETRSDKNKDIVYSHGDTHYRNLTNINYIKQLLENNNFKILFINESNNVAIYKNENPICIRVICQKQ